MTRRRIASSGLTVLLLALVFGISQLVSAQSQRNQNLALLDAVRFGRTEVAKRLLLAGADPNCEETRKLWKPEDPTSTAWNTPLIIATASEQPDMVALLLQHGARVNQQGDKGTTALMAAAYFKRTPMVRLLLGSGAKVNVKDAKGETAVDWAVEGLRRTGGSKSVMRHWRAETDTINRLLRQAEANDKSISQSHPINAFSARRLPLGPR